MALSLSNLPSDVVESVLLWLTNVDDLYAAILTCRQLYQTFDSRRSLILGSVFVSHVTDPNVRVFNGLVVSRTPHSHCGPKKRAESRRIAEAIISKCEDTPADAALLHSAIWYELMSRNATKYFHRGWGEVLMARLHCVGMYEAELKVAEDIWSHLTMTYTQDETLMSLDSGTRAFVLKLHKLYRKQNRHDDAIEILKSALSFVKQHHECELVIDLVNCFHQLGRSEEAIAYERHQYLDALNQPSVHGVNANAMTWARSLTREYLLAGRVADAIDLQKDVFSRRLNAPRGRDPSNLANLVGWARQTSQALKRAGRHEEAVQVKAQMFEVLLHPGPGGAVRSRQASSSLLPGWSKELIHDYSALHRPEDALAVQEAVWENLLSSLRRSPKDLSRGFQVRNAAMALAETYRRRDETDKAEEIMRKYESAAEIGGWKSSVETKVRGFR